MTNHGEAPSERWRRVERVYLSALGREGVERLALLDDLCRGDDTLRRDVESLLRVQPAAGSFLDTGAMEVAAEIMRGELGTDLIGQTVDGYTITGRLGAGGMGEVYRAHDSRLGRDVAIKVLPTELANDPDRCLSRFEREARALAALNHPNIATIHGIAQTAATSAGQASAVRAIILELVEGETLAERLARAPVPLNEALGIARQIAEALDDAHENGIIHRDLKPSNIKIRPDGRVKVLDFGLARLMNHVEGSPGFTGTEPLTVAATQPGQVIGTAAYMSPEQARGLPVDKRTDIWAFGCVLYEMLAGRPAFGGPTTSDTIASVLEREPDWSAMPPRTPADVMNLVQRCLEKDVRHRLRDVGDSQRVLSGLGDVRQSTPVERSASTRRALPWIAVVAALAVAVGMWFLRPSAPAGPIQTIRAQITIPDNGTIPATFSNALAVAPDGRKIAMVVEVNQKTGVWVKKLEESTPQFVTGSGGAQYVLWSPDSKYLVFRVLDKLLKFDLGHTSSAPVVIAPMPIGPTLGADWGDDGTSAGAILFWGGTGLMRVAGSGGEPVAIGVTDAFHPRMLPGGRFFYSSIQKAVFGAPLGHPAAPVEILKEDAAPVYAPRAGESGKRGDGFLLWIRGTTLLAQGFDPSIMRRAGEATVLADPAWTVAVSPSLLLFDPAPAMTQLTWVDRGGKPLQLVGDPAPFASTTMSPDGSRVVVTVARNAGTPAGPLQMLRTQRGSLTNLSDIGFNTSPVWSPDGQTVLYGGSEGLTRIAVSGVGNPEVVYPFTRRINPTDWSRRGFVLFNQFGLGTEMDPSTEMNVMMLQVMPDGKPVGEARPYLQKPGAQRDAQFSPDGGWVAYEESSESRQSEVFIDTFPERRGAIPISINGGFDAHWNPQGGELFYRSPAGKLMVVRVTMDGNSADVQTPKELFTLPVNALASFGSQYDVSQDGTRFLIQEPVKKAPLELITNWQALLK